MFVWILAVDTKTDQKDQLKFINPWLLQQRPSTNVSAMFSQNDAIPLISGSQAELGLTAYPALRMAAYPLPSLPRDKTCSIIYRSKLDDQYDTIGK